MAAAVVTAGGLRGIGGGDRGFSKLELLFGGNRGLPGGVVPAVAGAGVVAAADAL